MNGTLDVNCQVVESTEVKYSNQLDKEQIDKLLLLVEEYKIKNKISDGFKVYENRSQSCRLVEDMLDIIGYHIMENT